MVQSDYDRLLLLFKRSHSLPELPGIAMRLIQAVDSGEASAIDIERIISSDPMVAAQVLRLANSASMVSTSHGITTMRMAIMRLGQKTVRALAMSLLMLKLTKTAGLLNAQRVAHHSLFTAFLARYLYARRHQRQAFETQWSGDEIFAAALLHDLGVVLLAQVSPDSFARIRGYAHRSGSSFESAFEKIYQKPLSSLACAAAEAWGLPAIFIKCLCYYEQPWAYPEEFPALCCINYANYLGNVSGVSAEEWPVSSTLDAEIIEEVALPEEEAAKVLDLINQQVETYIEAAETHSSMARVA